uniref:TOBE domain-containing protein n=1 Tax=Castellaniella defragrans TaxID=75697 RepID=UPI003342905E
MTRRPSHPELTTSLTLRSQEQNWGTERRMALLAAIGTEGSISAAARKVGLSYKAAWDAVDTMNNLADRPLVERMTGGKHGGGASLTQRARDLIDWYERIHQEHQRFMDVLARFGPDAPRNLELLQYMMVQTSARNRLLGTIQRIVPGEVNDEITLETAEGLPIVAHITHVSTDTLGLREGRRALAFIKAPAVTLAQIGPDARLSARNQLRGTISRIVGGKHQAEVSVDVAPNTRITATLSGEELRAMALAEGQDILAAFKASDVLLGTLD